MTPFSVPYAPYIRSEISGGLKFIVPFMGMALAMGVFFFIKGWDTPDPLKKLYGLAFMAMPVYVYTTILRGYYAIRIQDGWISLRGVFQNGSFPLSDIVQYAILHRKIRGTPVETLHLALSDNSLLKIDSTLYRNYTSIRDIITSGKTPDPAIQARAAKNQKHVEWVRLNWAVGILVLVGCYVWHEGQKPPLSEADMQPLRITLLEKPEVSTKTSGSGQRRTTSYFMELHSKELPAVSFLLEGDAYDAANIPSLTHSLESGDSLWVMVQKSDRKTIKKAKKSPDEMSGSSINVFAIQGTGGIFLSLEAYDMALKLKLNLALWVIAANLIILIILDGWKYRQYAKLPSS